MKYVEFQILGDDNYRENGIHPARLVDPATKEVLYEFCVNPTQVLQEFYDEWLLQSYLHIQVREKPIMNPKR